MMIDPKDIKAGIQELRALDSLKIKKVRELKENQRITENNLVPEYNEYFVYSEKGLTGAGATGGVKISPDSIIYCTSGLMNSQKTMVLSYLSLIHI